MTGRRSRVIVALLSIGFVQASALAVCTSTADLNAAQPPCHHMPWPHSSCCATQAAVQAAMPESLPRWERTLAASHMLALPASAQTLEGALGVEPADSGPAVWVGPDQFLRIHVLRI